MIANIVTDPKTGVPVDGNGNAIAASMYQPPPKIRELFARCTQDYQQAWLLQHRPFPEFDGLSLLDRVRLDQKTFGAYVGMAYDGRKNTWRWQGRKNTARNKIIGILAHLISTILIPAVYATDDQQQDDKISAQAMRVLVEEYLRKADYEIKFMYMVLGALVHPAVFVQVEWVEALKTVKQNLGSGKVKIAQAVDDLLSGLALNIVPIDEMMLGDFFTFGIQRQPYVVRIRRISYDEARGRYKGKYFDVDASGKTVDRFDFVRAGTTRIFLASQEGITLYDVPWTEADNNMVQAATFYYPGEDLQVDFVGGVFMGNFDPQQPDEIYNLNPFDHRRMTQVETEWYSMPVLPFAMTGFEPLDPNMRFAYFKSAAHKEYWDDATLNVAHQLLVDGMKLDVIKPILISGIAKYDATVMAPGAVAALPKGAVVAPYQLGPNLAAAMNVLQQQDSDMQDSTIAKILEGQLGTRQSALAIQAAIKNAETMLGVFGGMISHLVRQIGDLTTDCIIQNTTTGDIDASIPGTLGMKYKTVLARGRDRGRNITHKMVFTDKYIGKKMTDAQKRKREFELWEEAGGTKKDAMRIWEINPYQFARKRYSTYLDTADLISHSSGADTQKKQLAFNMMMDPRVLPFIDQESVVTDFVIDEYGGNDPDKYKKKGNSSNLPAMMGAAPVAGQGGQQEGGGGKAPVPLPMQSVDTQGGGQNM